MHRLNQLKELRLSINKIRMSQEDSLLQSTALPPEKSHDQLVQGNENATSSFITFLEGGNEYVSVQSPQMDYCTRSAILSKKSVTGLSQQQRSLKEVEMLLHTASRPSRDCNEFEQQKNRLTMQSMQTPCPLLKQEKLIRNIKEAARRHQ